MEIDMPNSPSQTSPASSIPEEGQSALDGSEPATEDEIRELQQIEDFFRQYDCLPENYRLCQKMLLSTIKRNKNNWTIGPSPLLPGWFAAMTARISWPRGPSTLISLRKPTVPIPEAVPVRQTVQRKFNDSMGLE